MMMSRVLDKAQGMRRTQRGAALIVSLILLVVMTLLGMAAMNSSILQGFMSSSQQEQTRRLAQAEDFLLDGEFEVQRLVNDGVGVAQCGGTSCCPEGACYRNLVADPPDVAFATNLHATAFPGGNRAGGGYVIEYMGQFLVPGESVAEGGGFEDSWIHIFRVSARSVPGNERGGLRTVQSLYVTLIGPDL
jgi:type IV pilus assembly protein PilX